MENYVIVFIMSYIMLQHPHSFLSLLFGIYIGTKYNFKNIIDNIEKEINKLINK